MGDSRNRICRRSQSISASIPSGITNFGSVWPKSIRVTNGSEPNPNSASTCKSAASYASNLVLGCLQEQNAISPHGKLGPDRSAAKPIDGLQTTADQVASVLSFPLQPLPSRAGLQWPLLLIAFLVTPVPGCDCPTIGVRLNPRGRMVETMPWMEGSFRTSIKSSALERGV